MKNFQVRDSERVIKFDGVLLANVSSHTSGKQRWIELAMYKTHAGTYVLYGVGRTRMPDEVDRHWVQLADEPEGIIDRLTLHNDLGAKYIPHTSRSLLIDAGEQDDAIKQAFMAQQIA